MRAIHPDVDVDTCHGAFLLHRELTESLPILTQYDFVIVDEISMPSEEDFNRMVAMWHAASKLPCFVVLGDFWQLPCPRSPPSSVQDSDAWPFVKKIEFVESLRCKDPALAKKLAALRTSMPSKELLREICAPRHRAWRTRRPTAWDVQQLMRRTKNKTTIVTCTKKAAGEVNELCVKVLFEHRHKAVIGRLPFDFESNPKNYNKGKLVEGKPPRPMQTNVYEGLRIFLTRNLNKREDYVNGMAATVEEYDEESKCLRVMTATNRRLAIYPVTDDVPKCGRVTHYPARLGYASTVNKVQGATLDHVTLYLDRPGAKAAGYVALSRVRRDRDYLIGGGVTPRHFTPAM